MQLSDTFLNDLTAKLARVINGCGSLPVSRDDLISEVILRLLAVEDREVRNPYAYARTILRNLIRDHLRRAERAQRALEEIAARTADSVSGHEEAARFDESELVGYLLDQTALSPLQNRVIRMFYLNGMTLTEIARELSRNPGTILRHLRRAIDKLASRAAELELQP